MTDVEPENIAAPYEPVYPLFRESSGLVDLPTVKAHRGPIVWRKETAWDRRRYEVKRQGRRVRHWVYSWWWPARIRVLEREVRYLRSELDLDE